MTSLGFENYAEALKIYLAKYRDVCCVLPSSTGLLPRNLVSGRSRTSPYLINLGPLTQPLQQSQTNRTDNQQRPGSQGYGAGAAGPSGAGQVYPGAEGAAGLLGAQQGEPGGDAGGFMYAPQPGHNGTGAEGPY